MRLWLLDKEVEQILARLDCVETALTRKIGPWVNSAEAADYLRCSPRKVEALTRRGLLPYKRQDPTVPKSPRLYHRRELTAFLITGKNPETHPLTKEEKMRVEELL